MDKECNPVNQATGRTACKKIITLIRHEGYVLLVCTLGVVGIIEGLRVDAKVQSASFLSGPGGYLTIIGISLLLFGIIDIIRQLILQHTSKRVPDVAPDG